MNVEATAEALAPEQHVQVPDVTPEAPSMDDELGALWDKAQESPETENQTPDQPVEEATAEEQPLEEPAPEPEKVEIPSDIPRQLKEHWSKLPEESRMAVEDFARETNRKMSEQGRLIAGISPIRDALTEAVKDFPQLADMRPAEVAKEVFQLAQISAQFNTDPVRTMLGLIQKHGLQQQVQQALNGQQVTDNVTPLKQEISMLKRQLSQYADPEYIRSQVSAVTEEQQTIGTVQQFASTAEHWAAVEDKLPAYVQFMRGEMGQDASAKDVLEAAYNLAVSRIVPPEPKAPEQAADQAADVVDPEKAKAALKAKSVNVRSQPSKPKTMTEDELLANVWDKSQKR